MAARGNSWFVTAAHRAYAISVWQPCSADAIWLSAGRKMEGGLCGSRVNC